MDETIRIVSVADSALDARAMGESFADWLRTRDMSLVRERPGMRCTVFHLRRIPTSVFNRFVRVGQSEPERYQRAFQVAVTQIDHLQGPDGGSLSKVPTGSVHGSHGPLPAWTDAEIDHIPPAYVEEIGWYAWDRSFLVPGSGARSPLPRTLLPVLAIRAEEARLSAAQARRALDPSIDAQSSCDRQESEHGSDEGGGATAMG